MRGPAEHRENIRGYRLRTASRGPRERFLEWHFVRSMSIEDGLVVDDVAGTEDAVSAGRIFEPVTIAATFCSSMTFQSMNSSMSGWSKSRQTILAARLVVPPDLIAPAARSPMRRKDMRPDERPPPDRDSPSPRSLEKFVPVPDPYLNKRASRTHRSMMPCSLTRSSSIDWMKQACGWGCSKALAALATSRVLDRRSSGLVRVQTIHRRSGVRC